MNQNQISESVSEPDGLRIAIGKRYKELGRISEKIAMYKRDAKKILKEIHQLKTEGKLW